MDTNGSIKASGIRGSSFRPTQAEPALLNTAKQFLESFQLDTRIRQPLYEDKLEQSVGKHTYYILGHEQKYEPGFLLIMRNHPVVFLDSRFRYAYVLRMRLHSSLYQNQAVFVGTLDTLYASFRLEDVWVLNGRVAYSDPYSKRYKLLQDFFTTMFVQDKQFSGFTLNIAKVSPLSDLKKIVESKEFYSVDFIPEHGGRRRWFLPLWHTQKQAAIADAPFNAKGPEKTLVEAVIPAVSESKPQETKPKETKPQEPKPKIFTEAIARKIVGMPDVYSLQSSTNLDLGRAAVQSIGVSMLLRDEFTKKRQDAVPVAIQWYEEFQRYKITGISS